jgi:hypothetical protein
MKNIQFQLKEKALLGYVAAPARGLQLVRILAKDLGRARGRPYSFWPTNPNGANHKPCSKGRRLQVK